MVRRLLLLAALLAAALTVPSPATAGNLYGWTISASSSDPFVNSGLPAPGTRDLFLWLTCSPHDGLTAAEFDLIIGGGLALQSVSPQNGFVNAGSGPEVRLGYAGGCVWGPVVAAKLTFFDAGPGTICFAPSSDNGVNATRDCSTTAPALWTNDFVGFATIFEGPCASPSFCDPPDADLSLTKTTYNLEPAPGGRFQYKLSLGNDGPNAAFDIVVSDPLPSQVSYVSSVADAGSYDPILGEWWIESLPNGANVDLLIEVEVTGAGVGESFWNYAWVDAAVDDPDPWNDVDSVAVVVAVPDIVAEMPELDVSEGSPTNVTIQVTNADYVDDVVLQFRRGGQTQFTGVEMTRTGTGSQFTAQVPAGHVTRTGVQYFCTVTTTNATTLRLPEEGYGTINVEFDQPVEVSMPLAQFQLLGLPLVPERGGDPLSVFDELGDYDTFEWRYGTFDGSGYRDGPGAARNLQPGVGFWLYDRQGRTIGVRGTSTPLDEPFVVTVPSGWSIVANPFPFPIDASAVVRGNGVSGDFVAWTGTEYQHFAAQLEPGRGYWVFNGSSVAQTLLFPVDAVPTQRAGSDPWRPHDTGDGWFASLRATAGDLEDPGNYFGMAAAASASLDDTDFRESPPPPGRFVQLAFVREGVRLQVDSRPPAAGAVWEVALATGGVDEPVRLAADDLDELPSGWRLVALAGQGLFRWDLGAGEVIADARALDDLRVIAGPPEFVSDSVAQLEIEGAREVAGLTLVVGPNPTSDRATVSLGVPRASPASVVVFDLSGRLVRTLHRGPLIAGVHRFAWDGRESSGAQVGGGGLLRAGRDRGGESHREGDLPAVVKKRATRPFRPGYKSMCPRRLEGHAVDKRYRIRDSPARVPGETLRKASRGSTPTRSSGGRTAPLRACSASRGPSSRAIPGASFCRSLPTPAPMKSGRRCGAVSPWRKSSSTFVCRPATRFRRG